MSDIFNNALQQPAGAPSAVQGPSEEVQKELRTRFELLPEELQTVITSSDYQMKLFELAKKYKMTYEKLGSLELETTLVLLGMTHPKDFSTEVKDLLKLKDEDFTNLMNDIQAQIFDPIKSALHHVYEDGEDEETVENKTLPQNETRVMTNAGVTVGSINTPQVTPTDTRATTLKESDLMSAIENPTKSTATVLNPISKPTTPVPNTTAKISPQNAESMQDSINKLLNNTETQVKTGISSLEETLKSKLSGSDLSTPLTSTVIPDMPPLAPIEATNKVVTNQTASPMQKAVDTITPIKRTVVDIPAVQYDANGKVIDPYKEQI